MTAAGPGEPGTPRPAAVPAAADGGDPADVFAAAGGFDLQGLMAQAQQMQEHLAQAQEDLAAARVVGTSGGGLVTATVSGTGELLDLSIDPDVLDPSDQDAAQTVADLVLAAVRDAASNAREGAEELLGPFAQGLGGADGPGGLAGLGFTDA